MLLEYQLDWIKIVDFLSIAKFSASANNFRPPSIIPESKTRSTLDHEVSTAN